MTRLLRTALAALYILLLTGVLVVAVLEIVVRRSDRLAASSHADPASGIAAAWLEQKWAALKDARPDVVFIGDSFVETGEIEGGWVRRLQESGRNGFALGYAGAAPGQYVELYRRARGAGYEGSIAIVVYLGNDLEDEIVWRQTGDKTRYMDARRAHLSNPATPLFWPCYEDSADRRSAVRRRLSLYKHLFTVSTSGAVSKALGVSTWDSMESLMRKRCSRAPYAEIVNDRVFFFRHHDALLMRATAGGSLEPFVRTFEPLVADTRVVIVSVFSREENCRGFHGRSVASARPVVERLRAMGLRVVDPNERFARSCGERFPYLPDGHWNEAGHALFADAMSEALFR